MIPLLERGIRPAVMAAIILFLAASPLTAQDSQPEAPALSVRLSLLPDPETGPERVLARDLSLVGVAAFAGLAAWGGASVFEGIGEEFDGRAINRAVCMAVSGSLGAALFLSLADFYAGPPERPRATIWKE